MLNRKKTMSMNLTNAEIGLAHYCKQRYCYHDVNNHPKRAKFWNYIAEFLYKDLNLFV